MLDIPRRAQDRRLDPPNDEGHHQYCPAIDQDIKGECKCRSLMRADEANAADAANDREREG